uniref:KIAA0319 n=1 Tax=Fundulus heteroclitus TaxID=8078 RepID=A0A3Q2UP84_FUNHE
MVSPLEENSCKWRINRCSSAQAANPNSASMWRETALLLIYILEAAVASTCWQGATFPEAVVSPAVESSRIMRVPGVASLEQCVVACCDLPGYNLAWLFKGRCYILSCQQGANCQPQVRPGADSVLAFLQRASPQSLLLQSLVRGAPYGGSWGSERDLEPLKGLALFDGPRAGQSDPGMGGVEYSEGSQELRGRAGPEVDPTQDTFNQSQEEGSEGEEAKSNVTQIRMLSDSKSGHEDRTEAPTDVAVAEKTAKTQKTAILPSLARDSAPTPGADSAPTPGADSAPTSGADSALTPAVGSAPTPGANSAPTPGAGSAPTPGANSAPTPGADPTPTHSYDIIITRVNPGPSLAASLGNPVDISAATTSEPSGFSEAGNKHASDPVRFLPSSWTDPLIQRVSSDHSTMGTWASATAARSLPPVAHASGSHVLTLPNNSLVLKGSVTDGDQTQVRYQWTRDSQSPAAGEVLFGSETQPSLYLSDLVEGTYLFQLRVTDAQGRSSSATATVEVRPEPGGGQQVELELLVSVSQVSVAQRDAVVGQLATVIHVLERDIWVRALQRRTHLSTVLQFSVQGPAGPLAASSLVVLLRKQLLRERSDFLLFKVLRVDTVACELSCSGRGQCDPITKQCSCDPFWTENLIRLYLGDGQSNCEWRVLYVILSSFLMMVFILSLSWAFICCSRRRKRTKGRKKTRYTILDDMDEQERLELRPRFSLKHRSTEHNSSLMMSESELDSDQDAVFSRPVRNRSRVGSQPGRSGNAFG